MVTTVRPATSSNDAQLRPRVEPGSVTRPSQEINKEELHAKPKQLTENFEFSKITADTTEDSKLKKLLNRFEINGRATKYDNAVLSKDGKTLLMVNRGQVGLRELFGGETALGRGLYKVYGWLARACGFAHKSIAAGKYREMFNGADIDMQHEPLKHLFKALKSGEYHTVSVFYRDPNTGDFDKDPNAVAVIDAYENIIEPNLRRLMKDHKELEIQNEINKRQEEFIDCYSLDKMIPIKDGLKMRELFHQVAEGLLEAQGFKILALPSQVNTYPNMNSDNLNYQEIDFHHVAQDPDANWFVSGDPKVLDSLDSISKEDKDRYRQKLRPSSYSPKLTIVRPLADASKPINPYLAYVQQWSLISQGSDLRATKKEDLDLVELSEPINAAIINAHNLKLAPR